MREFTPLVLLLALWPPPAGVQAPTAVISDPPQDKAFPAAMATITVPSHGVEMDAIFYLASGAGPHGTVLLLHGLPGYELNADLAQSIRRAGWNALIFHYRGTWGTGGAFSMTAAIEDTADALRFLRDPATVMKYRIDPARLVVIGHSAGGFLAAWAGSHDPGVSATGIITAVNVAKINADPKERALRIKRWQSQLHPVRGATAAQLFAEAEQHTKDWDYVQWADALRARPVLLLEVDDQNRPDMEALAAALRDRHAVAVEHKHLASDHSFSDSRIALQSIVVEWLGTLKH